MADNDKNATATATADKPKQTRNRKPSAFSPRVRVTISTHADVTDVTATEAQEAITKAFGEKYAVRAVSRTRKTKTGKPSAGPANVMVYIAPQGFTFAASAERGVRLDAETANLLREAAAKLGVDANDPAGLIAVAKALASNVLSK